MVPDNNDDSPLVRLPHVGGEGNFAPAVLFGAHSRRQVFIDFVTQGGCDESSIAFVTSTEGEEDATCWHQVQNMPFA